MRSRTLLLLAPALLSACVTATTTTRTWGEAEGGGYARAGRVESIRETVHRYQGDPAAGAAAGAVVGGLLGAALGGSGYYDHWGRYHYQGSAGGAVVGAIGGAAVGAAASQASSGEERIYEVVVRFDDGGYQTFAYRGGSPFQVGELVVLGPQGLTRS
jgi:outer membrane lipoprotein SlyB